MNETYWWLADKLTTDEQRQSTLRQGLLRALKNHQHYSKRPKEIVPHTHYQASHRHD